MERKKYDEKQMQKYVKSKDIERRTAMKMYDVLWVKEIEFNWNIITLETIRFRNWTIIESFKNIRKKY